jgi:putative transposase
MKNGNIIFRQKQIKPLVEIMCFCLMPNHFHIAIRQLVDGGIAKLIQRVGNSYTKYFNIKNGRKGSLFMARYKSIHINKDSQLRHLISYIHANPLDLVAPEWRGGKIKNQNKARNFLENYIWSSFPFYTKGEGRELIHRMIKPGLIKTFYPAKKDHFEYIFSWSGRNNNSSTLNVDVE